MRMYIVLCIAIVGAGILAGIGAPAAAQTGPDFFYTDQLNNRIIRALDRDNDGKYVSPGEFISFHRSTDLTPRVQSMRIYPTLAGTYMLWTDRNGPGVFLADLKVKSGRLNRSETTKFFHLDGPDDAVMDTNNVVWAVNDYGQKLGLWRLEDKNRDGDAMDGGESTLMVSKTLQIQVPGLTTPVTIGGDDFEGMAMDSAGYILAYEQTDEVVYRFQDLNKDGDFKDTGEAVNFLNYATNVPGLIQNPDFKSGFIPPLRGLQYANLEMISVDTTGSQDIYYFGVYFGPTNRIGHIYQGVDKNRNGHLNEAGEVTLFHDGTTGLPSPVIIGEGMDVYNGLIYLMDDNTTRDRIIRFSDNNLDGDALDKGEQTVVFHDPNGGGATGPYCEALTVVQPGTLPVPNSTTGQTFLYGTPKAKEKIFFALTDLAPGDAGGTGYVALSFSGDGRFTGGIPLHDGINRFVPIDFDNLTALSLTALLPYFTTRPVANNTTITKDYAMPAGMPPGIILFAAGVIYTTQNQFGSVTDAVKFVTQ